MYRPMGSGEMINIKRSRRPGSGLVAVSIAACCCRLYCRFWLPFDRQYRGMAFYWHLKIQGTRRFTIPREMFIADY